MVPVLGSRVLPLPHRDPSDRGQVLDKVYLITPRDATSTTAAAARGDHTSFFIGHSRHHRKHIRAAPESEGHRNRAVKGRHNHGGSLLLLLSCC